MRTVLWVVALVLLIVPAWSGYVRLPLPGPRGSATLVLTPVPLRASAPGSNELGALTFLEGWELTSDDPSFGGYSAIAVRDGRMTLLNDGGNFLRFRLTPEGKAGDPVFGTLPGGPGTGWEKRDRDSESLAFLPDGDALVGFESEHHIWRYSADLTRAKAFVAPREMRRWPRNGGAEAMVARRRGDVFVFGEKTISRRKPGAAALWFSGDPTRKDTRRFEFRFKSPPGYAVSDAAELPDGRLLVLQRRFQVLDGFDSARLFSLSDAFDVMVALVDPRQIRKDAVVSGKQIARLSGDVIRENYEALTVARENGRLILWIASDDNEGLLQRTLLLKFELHPERLPK